MSRDGTCETEEQSADVEKRLMLRSQVFKMRPKAQESTTLRIICAGLWKPGASEFGIEENRMGMKKGERLHLQSDPAYMNRR